MYDFVVGNNFLKLFLNFVLVIYLRCRHYRYEQTLAGLLWKIDMKDVTIINMENANDYNNTLKNKNIVSSGREEMDERGGERECLPLALILISFFLIFSFLIIFKYQICRQSILTGGDTNKKAFTNIGKFTEVKKTMKN